MNDPLDPGIRRRKTVEAMLRAAQALYGTGEILQIVWGTGKLADRGVVVRQQAYELDCQNFWIEGKVPMLLFLGHRRKIT